MPLYKVAMKAEIKSDDDMGETITGLKEDLAAYLEKNNDIKKIYIEYAERIMKND